MKVQAEINVDLMKLPVADWPKEAKDCAIGILQQTENRHRFMGQLPDFRKSWLVARIERFDSLKEL